MAYALADLLTVETRETVLADILDIGASVFLKVTSWQSGQPIRTILTYCSQKIADVTIQNREAIAGGFLDEATEGWLSLLAWSVYRVSRRLASAGTTNTFQYTNGNSTDAAHFLPGDLVVAHAVTGKTYHNLDEITIAPGTVKSDILIEADEVGTGSNAATGEITTLVSVRVGGSVTNLQPCLGSDDEDDPSLRARCRSKLGSLSPNGPKEAFDFVVKTQFFEDGTACCPTAVPITRSQVVLNNFTGDLTVYIATDAGAPTGGDVAIADAAVDRWATPWLVDAHAIAATEVPVPVTYSAWIKSSNLTVAQQKSLILLALTEMVKRVPIGGARVNPDIDTVGYLYHDTFIVTIVGAVTAVIRATVAAPSADTALADGQVVTLGTVTGTVTVVT